MKKIPLRKKDGSIVAWTIVDDEDCEWACQWTWRLSKNNTHRIGYAGRGVRVNGKIKTIYLHREIAKRAGIDTSQLVDHISGDSLDNRRANLRAASHAGNVQNSVKRSNNSSGFVGVCRRKDRRKWRAQININGKLKHLGDYDTAIQAGVTAAIHRIIEHEDFANNVGQITEFQPAAINAA